MKKKDWKKRLGELSFTKGYYFKLADNGLVEKKDDQLIFNREVLESFIEQELEKAREEVEDKFREKYKKREEEMNVPYSEEDGKEFWQGYQEGYHQGLKDMVVDTHYLDEEFQSKLAGII